MRGDGDGGSGWDLLPANRRAALKAQVMVRDGRVCQLRIKGVCTYTATQVDHIRLARIHGHGLDNLQAACAPCNRRKGEPVDDTDPQPLAGAW